MRTRGCFALVGLLVVFQARAGDFLQRFTDPTDGWLDMSQFVLDHKGPLAVPIIITEPAVGYGGGAALVFIRQSLEEQAAKAKNNGGHVAPPDVFGVAAFATENGSKGVAGGGQFTFRDDRFRYRGGVADLSLNLDFYGVGGSLPVPVGKIAYSLKGFASFQQGMMRLGEGDNFVGVRWIYLNLNSNLDVDTGATGLTPQQFAERSSGIGLTFEHDSRDNIFTPSKGWLGAADATYYDPSLGSDNHFETYRAHVFYYFPITHALTLGLRADGRLATGNVPFYMLPYIDLRGVTAGQFQNTHTVVVETEARYDFTSRWAAIAFVGDGRAWGERKSFSDSDNEVAKGLGFRYLLARRLGLWAGMDYAWGPQDQTFYIQIGNAWR